MTDSSEQSLEQRSVILGKGGGFTGEYKEYIIKGNGNVHSRDPMDTSSIQLIKTLTSGESNSLFKELEELDFPDPEFNHPGNITYYIHYSKEDTTKKIKWGSPGKAPPQGFKEFYDKVMKMVAPD